MFKAEKVAVLDMAEGKGSDGIYSGLASLTSRAVASSCVRAEVLGLKPRANDLFAPRSVHFFTMFSRCALVCPTQAM